MSLKNEQTKKQNRDPLSFSVSLRLSQQCRAHHNRHHAWWRQTNAADPPAEEGQEVPLQGEEPKFPPRDFSRWAGWPARTAVAPAGPWKGGGGEAQRARGHSRGGVVCRRLSSGAVPLPAGRDGDGDGRHGAGLREGEGVRRSDSASKTFCSCSSLWHLQK